MDFEQLEFLCESFEKLAANSPRADYMRDYMRERYKVRRQKAIQELGGQCVRCGDKNNLHFDHIDKKKKKFRFSDINSISDENLKTELGNCQLLCPSCHKKKTHEAWDYNAPKSQHSTYWMYRRHGCRCAGCTKAYKAKIKEWRTKP